ncbi:hypothetical protein [Alysiella filiformis]|uniref:Uncharacterized protein n=1 Tax=Alysiella filiformis DSM 16848 TaxID=1120981 RepID=A0A286E949_9NEIS|nr:hypothetical protein [Alysiella filiformis]QMT31452.1 hypothetical protein H3L97_00615 [Alysiella filiformis]UBQ55536.1 hypothetical protein JF568_08060 [Alysiella filiformis DSM 16848]SOD67427.1 hypothetical protein SAMN02746062_00900 [Alysiella filiformis DSM 16848]
MADYQSKLLDIVNQHGYRLPEPSVFAALEEFKTQANQVLAYKGLGVHFRHLINDPNDPNDDGGQIVLYNAQHQFVSILANWTYGHPFHTFPVKLSFADEEYACHTADDVEIALTALIESDVFKQVLNLSKR